jgi:hypothetical protein
MSFETPPAPEHIDWFRQWIDALPAVALASAGGVVRALVVKRRKTCRVITVFMDLAISAVVAAFAGAITYFFLEGSAMGPGIRAGLCGMAGYSGTELLRVLSRRLVASAKDCDL